MLIRLTLAVYPLRGQGTAWRAWPKSGGCGLAERLVGLWKPGSLCGGRPELHHA